MKQDAEYTEGQTFGGGGPRNTTAPITAGCSTTAKKASSTARFAPLIPKTGEKKWEFRMADVTDAGILTTASDLLFSGGREGYFFALDARNGSLLWKTVVGGRVASGPMTYAVNGKQYVAVSAGNSLFVYALRQ